MVFDFDRILSSIEYRNVFDILIERLRYLIVKKGDF